VSTYHQQLGSATPLPCWQAKDRSPQQKEPGLRKM